MYIDKNKQYFIWITSDGPNVLGKNIFLHDENYKKLDINIVDFFILKMVILLYFIIVESLF